MFHDLPSSNLSERAKRRVGTIVRGKYALVELLGTGGMASVYRARHRTGRELAVKIVHAELQQRLDTRAWLLREAMLTNAIDHPGVMRVLDDDVDDAGSPMLVMDLVRGESLAERVARVGGRLPAGRVLDIADRTLDVLAAVHARSVVHCDIKPDNVLLVEGGVALLDFGIARAKDFEGLPPLPDAVAREPMGTPDFMPPEQAAGRWEWVDARSDIYALGATLFLLLTGRFVRDGVSVSSQLEAARCHRAPSLCAIAPGLRSVLGDVVDRALAFDPDARHPSARAMQEAVRRAKERYVEGAEEELENRYRQKHASGLYLSARSTLPAGGRIARAS